MIFCSKSFIIISLFLYFTYHQGIRINKLSKTMTKHMDHKLRQLALNANSLQQISLGNVQNYLYYININVGTPSQNFNVQFDTGSNILWLPLTGSGSLITFNSSKSSTFNNTSTPGQIQYADGSGVIGTMGSDVLQISNTNINVNQPILWVTQEIDFQSFPPFVAGLVGMGFTSSPNFLDLAYQQGQIDSPAFTLSIRSNTSSNSSYLYYNDIPDYIQNSTTFVSVIGDYYWQVSVIGVIIGGIDMSSLSSSVAVIDSGTSYFYVNADLFNQIVNTFFSNCNNTAPTPICPCSSVASWPEFAFLFDGIQVYIQALQYAVYLDSFMTQCTYNFGTLSTVANQLLLGDTFFQSYDITFNKLTQQVGFSGNVDNLTKIIPLGRNEAQYILLGILILLGIFGGLSFYCMNDINNPRLSAEIGLEYEISNYGNSRRRQPFLGKRVVINP